MSSRLSQKKLPRIFVISIILFGVCLAIVVLEKTRTTDIVKMPQSAEQKKAAEQSKAQEEAAAEAKQTFLDEAAKPPSEQPPQQQETQPGLTLSTKQDTANVTVLTQMSGVTAGECILEVRNGGMTTSQKAQVIYQPEFSSCAGFSVPKSTVGAGQWQITVTVTTSSGQTLSQNTSLEAT